MTPSRGTGQQAKYYVYQKDTNGRWWLLAVALSKLSAFAFAGHITPLCDLHERRITYKGKIIARWKDGQRVSGAKR